MRDGLQCGCVEAAIEEGCVGETLAAAEALHKSQHAVVPVARRALLAIAEEETQHAELAWAFVRWVLAEHPELRPVAKRAFQRAAPPLWDFEPEGQTARAKVLLAHGVLDDVTRRRVRRVAYLEVVRPGSALLLTTS